MSNLIGAKCEVCPFKGKRVLSEGNPETCKYVLMGEAPGRLEVVTGKPFVGDTGKLLDAFLSQIGLTLHSEDFYLMNAISCAVSSKSKTEQAVHACAGRVQAELDLINEEAIIVVMGKNARESLYPGEQGGILGSRGWREWQGRNIYITVHPSFFLFNPDEAPMMVKDIKRFVRGRQPQIGPFEIAYLIPIPSSNTFTKVSGEDYEEAEAARAYDEAAKERFGDFAFLNFPAKKLEYVGIVLDTHEKLDWFISKLHAIPMEDRDFLAFDLETDQVDFQRDRILCMSISLKEGEAYIIPDSLLYLDRMEFVTTNWSKPKWKKFMGDRRYQTGSYLRPDPKTVSAIRELFAIPKYRWTGQNSKFDMRFLHNYGIVNVHTEFDTIVAHYTLDERMGGHALKPLSDDYFDVGNYEGELFNYIDKKSAHYSQIPRRVLYKYNFMDTECTLRLARELEKELLADDLYERPFMYPMMAALPMLVAAEIEGVTVDWDEVDRIEYEELQPALLLIEEELREISGRPDLNPLSSVRINEVLYDELGLPIVEARTRAGGHKVTGRSSQSAIMDVWKQMYEQGKLHVSEEAWHFVEKLREYRHLRKLLGSYIQKWRNYRGTDNHVHTSFLLRGTVTGRLSSRDPPMQTIPSKVTDKWGPMVANIHKPEPGWALMYADFSQAELMAIASLSNDQFMINAFQKEGVDYHSEVSMAAFGDLTKDHRVASKRLTFGWAYGGNVKEIAIQALQVDNNLAEKFAKDWDERFQGVVKWRQSQGELMVSQGYVASVFGRRRRQLLLLPKNLGKAKRMAVNAPVQSAISDLNLLSAVRLYQRFKDTDYAKVILLIHDSLILTVRDDMVEEVKQIMHDTMLAVPKEVFPRIPFKAEVKVGYRLGDLT